VPKLTAKFIENEVQFPAQGQVILRDDDLKGFGLRVSPNCISYIVECRVDGKVKRPLSVGMDSSRLKKQEKKLRRC
jgi:hypothetical protein